MDTYREQLSNYVDFIQELIEANKILTRTFYVVIPYDPDRHVAFDETKEQIELRIDIVRKGLYRVGMPSKRLGDLEILELFYSFYSPEQSKLQPLNKKTLKAHHLEFIQKGYDRG